MRRECTREFTCIVDASVIRCGMSDIHFSLSSDVYRIATGAELIRMLSLSETVVLALGVANEQSIAWGCAKAFHGAGAELAITYLNDRAEPKWAHAPRRPTRRSRLRNLRRVLELPPLRIRVEHVEPSAANPPFIQLVATGA
jgi:hypothetical protein